MQQPTSMMQFSHGARAASRAARHRGLVVPSFRSPPRLAGVDRTIRRHLNFPVISIRLRGRPWVAVAADMVEGVVVANSLVGAEAVRVRGAIWAALGFTSESSIDEAADRRPAA